MGPNNTEKHTNENDIVENKSGESKIKFGRNDNLDLIQIELNKDWNEG